MAKVETVVNPQRIALSANVHFLWEAHKAAYIYEQGYETGSVTVSGTEIVVVGNNVTLQCVVNGTRITYYVPVDCWQWVQA